jgi:hypothetical protein
MDFASIRMITDDLEPVVQSCEQVTGTPVAGPVFAELRLPSCTIASGHAQAAQLFNNAAASRQPHRDHRVPGR